MDDLLTWENFSYQRIPAADLKPGDLFWYMRPTALCVCIKIEKDPTYMSAYNDYDTRYWYWSVDRNQTGYIVASGNVQLLLRV